LDEIAIPFLELTPVFLPKWASFKSCLRLSAKASLEESFLGSGLVAERKVLESPSVAGIAKLEARNFLRFISLKN
jgi:hypothetical protein